MASKSENSKLHRSGLSMNIAVEAVALGVKIDDVKFERDRIVVRDLAMRAANIDLFEYNAAKVNVTRAEWEKRRMEAANK